MLIGIIDPSSGTRRVLGRENPLDAATEIGYLPEERGLYPAMHARDAIAFMGALRGLPIAEGRRRADALLAEHNLEDWAKKSIRTLSKGMAQTVQLLGTIIHKPRLIILDEPFSGLDAINQARLEEMIRREARGGVTIIFSTHVIAHAERLCERVAIIAKGKVASTAGSTTLAQSFGQSSVCAPVQATVRGAPHSRRALAARARNGCLNCRPAVLSPC